MFTKILFLSLTLLSLQASNALKDIYYVDSKDINISLIIPEAKNDSQILRIEKSRYSIKIKTKDLIKILSEHGYKNLTSKSNYTNFILKSPIDTSYIEQKIKEYYKKEYEEIDIKSISVKPRGYITSMPKEYILNIRNNDFLSSSGIVNIKTTQNKKLFFDYYITANVPIYTSRDAIKKEMRISHSNCIKKNIVLENFRAKPLQNIDKKSFQAKRHIPKGMILTSRDVESLDVVKRDAAINVSLNKDGIAITFSAKALQDGKVNDIINVQNSSGKILKARVTGSSTAEIE